MKRNLATIFVALVISGGTATVVFAKTCGGSPDGRDASKSQYGCPTGTYGSHCLPPSGCSHGSTKSGSHNSHSSSYDKNSYDKFTSYHSSQFGNHWTFGSKDSKDHASEPSCSSIEYH